MLFFFFLSFFQNSNSVSNPLKSFTQFIAESICGVAVFTHLNLLNISNTNPNTNAPAVRQKGQQHTNSLQDVVG